MWAWWNGYRDKRKNSYARERYEDGFGFIMTEYFLNKKSTEQLEDVLYNPFDAQDSWDHGAKRALDTIKVLRVTGRIL